MKNATEPNLKSSNEDLALMMSALGHPARIAIVHRLACCDACCCKEVVDHLHLAQSTVSQHLKVLVQAGLVTYEPAHPKSRYVLNKNALAALSGSVADLVKTCCEPQAGSTLCR